MILLKIYGVKGLLMRCKADNKILTRYDFMIDPTGEYCHECYSKTNEILREMREDDQTKKVYNQYIKDLIKDKIKRVQSGE